MRDLLLVSITLSRMSCDRDIYRTWNVHLFEEMYKAYIDGRSDKNPVDGWYEGELKFFDGHVIPLAKRLITCQCFGIGGDEFLASAEQNRSEWAEKGNTIVAEMAAEVQPKDGGKAAPGSKPEESIASNGTSKTTETRPSTPEAPSFASPEFVDTADIADISESFLDELEIGSNGSVAC